MTDKEAINLLDNLIGMIDDNHGADYDTALKMGKKALEERKEGMWIDSPNGYFTQCSECGLHGAKGIYKHYGRCPKCGAKMSEIPTGSESEE